MAQKIRYILIIAVLALCLIIPMAQAQTPGSVINFEDLTLTHSQVNIFEIVNGSMEYIETINTSSSFQYDPTANYVFQWVPSISNTYGSSPGGVVEYTTNSPELAGIILIVIILLVALAWLIWSFRRRGR